MQDKENEMIYPIPPNYTDSGKIFGGMVSPRNLVEAILLVLALGFIEFKLIPMGETVTEAQHRKMISAKVGSATMPIHSIPKSARKISSAGEPQEIFPKSNVKTNITFSVCLRGRRGRQKSDCSIR